MKKNSFLSPGNYILITAVLIAVIAGIYFKRQAGNQQMAVKLPHFGPYELQGTDTLFHKVSDFQLIDQTGAKISLDNFKNSIIVADFFFTNCEGICPKMSKQMQRMFEKYKGNKSVSFISYTVDPERDSIAQLQNYAAQHKADASQWHFVSGDKKSLYEQARNSFMVVNTTGDGGPDDFVHTQNFALVDKDRYIRGYYDGTDSLEVNKLMKDIDLLLHAEEKN